MPRLRNSTLFMNRLRGCGLVILMAICSAGLLHGADAAPRTAASAITPNDRNPKKHAAFLERIGAIARNVR